MAVSRPWCKKRRYRDKLAAEMELARIKRRDKPRPKQEKRSYECPNCRGFHLTSMEESPAVVLR